MKKYATTYFKNTHEKNMLLVILKIHIKNMLLLILKTPMQKNMLLLLLKIPVQKNMLLLLLKIQSSQVYTTVTNNIVHQSTQMKSSVQLLHS